MAAALTVTAVGTLGGPAAATGAPRFAAGTVTPVAGLPAGLFAPADGRIAGDGFLATVTADTVTRRLAVDGRIVTAPAGSRFVAFTLAGAHPGTPTFPAVGTPASTVTGTLTAGSTAMPVPPVESTGPASYVTVVADNVDDIELALTAAGTTQTFDLATGKRTGPNLAALYRSQADWHTVVPEAQTTAFPTPIDDEHTVKNPQLAVTLTSVELTDFAANPLTGPPADPGEAYLVAHITTGPKADSQSPHWSYTTRLPASAVTLTLPSHPPVAAALTGVAGPDDETTDGRGIAAGDYVFTVPADLTSATLTVIPGTVGIQETFLSTVTATDPIAGQATFPITLPTPYAAPLAVGTPIVATAPEGEPTSAGPATIHPSAAGSHVALVAASTAAGVAVLAAGTGILLWRRRTHRHPDLPTPAPQGPPVRPSAPAAPAAPAGQSSPAPSTAPARPSGTPEWAADPQPSPVVAGAAGPKTPPPGSTGHSRQALDTPVSEPPSEAAAAPPVPGPVIVIPERPPAPAEGTSEVQLLGPVTATWAGTPPDRPTVTEMAAYLLLHPDRTHTAASIAEALSNSTRSVTVESVRTYASALRRAVGAAHLPAGGSGAGYRLIDVGTDIDRLTDLSTGSVSDQIAALALIRGSMFSDAARGAYEWAHHHQALHQTQTFVSSIALRLATSPEVPPAAADWALGQALRLNPYDERLLHARLDIPADIAALTTAWRACTSHLAAHDEPIPDGLVARYHAKRSALAH